MFQPSRHRVGVAQLDAVVGEGLAERAIKDNPLMPPSYLRLRGGRLRSTTAMALIAASAIALIAEIATGATDPMSALIFTK
ncbi:MULTISPECIES: hypothetical protein [Micromonospora]|uniref:Uncharacterized protein n=1 Tax=Micromonospora aurantiaca (nom. illeg.) TaxID=47850 RepID=A0ABQ6UAP3_9ACTN|nr:MULTISPECIES: hypothetical protein [Micromonospora]KAB1107806.1 hypothetical protein F6X54_25140 [Micromonospora aurantiaca]UFN93222.1 hypothetical protein LF814_25050 [Micromonospora aurantiaca]